MKTCRTMLLALVAACSILTGCADLPELQQRFQFAEISVDTNYHPSGTHLCEMEYYGELNNRPGGYPPPPQGSEEVFPVTFRLDYESECIRYDRVHPDVMVALPETIDIPLAIVPEEPFATLHFVNLSGAWERFGEGVLEGQEFRALGDPVVVAGVQANPSIYLYWGE